MASIADMLVQQAGTPIESPNVNYGANLAQGLETGANIAFKAEQLAQQKQELETKKAQHEDLKYDKFIDALQKGANYQGSARTNYYQKWLPRYRDSLGLTDAFPDESLQFATATPENLARLETLKADVQSGKLSRAQAIGVMNDPTSFADVPPDIKETAYKDLQEDAKTAINAEAQRQQMYAQESRFQREQRATGDQALRDQGRHSPHQRRAAAAHRLQRAARRPRRHRGPKRGEDPLQGDALWARALHDAERPVGPALHTLQLAGRRFWPLQSPRERRLSCRLLWLPRREPRRSGSRLVRVVPVGGARQLGNRLELLLPLIR